MADISLLLTNSQDVDFEFILPAVNMGCSALEMLYQKTDKKETLTGLVKHLQGLSQQARLASRHQVCVFVIKIVYSRSLYPPTKFKGYEPRHEISNNVVCATGKGSDQPALMRSLIRAFAHRLNVL